jgi:Arc/MetJ family transcription regulator
LEKRQIAIDKAGTLAEASLMLNGVFEATEKAAAQYLENIERLSGQQQRVCDAMEAAARERAKTILEEAEAACREREARCDAYEKALTQRLQKFYDQRPGLKELVQKAAAE